MFTRILVPTDFSEASDAALDYAKTLAARFGSSLHLLHVVDEPIASPGFGSELFVTESAGYAEAIRREAENRLAVRLTPAERTAMHATSDIVGGPCAAAIVEMAHARAVDLVVMGTHGRTGVAHAFVGSVAEQVVRRAPCPVLTVRPPRAVTAARPTWQTAAPGVLILSVL